MQLRRIIVLTSLMATALFQSAQAQSKDERTIRELSMAWQRWVANQQIDSIVALHTSDATVLMANSPPVQGSAAIREGWGGVAKLPGLNMHWTPTKIDVINSRVATEYGTYTDSWDGPNGRESDAGTYLAVWHKVNGKWRVAYDAPVSSMPVKPAAPVEATTFVGRNGGALAWSDFARPGFPPGAKISVLQGDPSKPGAFALRLSFPDGYQVPLHWHPTAEMVTVLSGGVNFGMGNAINSAAAQPVNAGDFAYIPARHSHWLVARGQTVVQVSGNGPFVLNLGAPK